MFCHNCGAEIPEDACICPKCSSLTRKGEKVFEKVEILEKQANNKPEVEIIEDGGTFWFVLLSILFPLIGFICGLVFAIKGKRPNRTATCFIFTVVGILINSLVIAMRLGAI